MAKANEYGYDLRPNERVSAAELEAISRKQAAIRDGSNVSIEEAQALLDRGVPEQGLHALVALYYAATTDPDVTDEDVDEFGELMHERTRHVDTSHEPTLRQILDDVLGDGGEGDPS